MTATNQQPAQPTAPTEPVVGVIYGPSGLGKTTDAVYAMPNAFFFGDPASVAKVARGVVGYDLHPKQVLKPKRLSDATALVPKLGKNFDGIVIDDLTLLTEDTKNIIDTEYKGSNKYAPWTILMKELMDLLAACKAYGKHVLLNAHEKGPRVANGITIRGGPKLPSDLPETLPARCDVVLRAMFEPTRPPPWQAVYKCSIMDPSFVTKDRHNVTPDNAPMNLGEILRAAGYPLRRASGLEWMDEVVYHASEALFGGTSAVEVNRWIAGHTKAHYVAGQEDLWQKHTIWALRDANDRVILRRYRSNRLSAFPGL